MHGTQNEYSLLTEMMAGDQTAFRELYFIYASAIHTNIGKLIKDKEVANDILQEVFLALWKNRHKIDPQKGIAPWLYTVSYNKSLNFLRKKIREELVITHAVDITLFADETDARFEEDEIKLAVIYEALEHLPERKKIAFFEYRIKGKSLNEVADTMGITKEAVKGYVKDARKLILNYIESKPTAPSSLAITAFILWLS